MPSGVTFHYIATPATWTQAQATCRGFGVGWNLATITSAEENAAAADFALQNVWIGLKHEPTSASTFYWVSGVTNSFRKWEGGEPNNLNPALSAYEGYAFLKGKADSYKGNWNNLKETTTVYILCSVRASPQWAPISLSVRHTYYASARARNPQIDAFGSFLRYADRCMSLL
jgi:hypothetical protein